MTNPNFEGYLVYNEANTLLGYIGGVNEIYFIGHAFIIEDFFVVKQYQGLGMGSVILEIFESTLRNRGVVLTRFFTAKIPHGQTTKLILLIMKIGSKIDNNAHIRASQIPVCRGESR